MLLALRRATPQIRHDVFASLKAFPSARSSSSSSNQRFSFLSPQALPTENAQQKKKQKVVPVLEIPPGIPKLTLPTDASVLPLSSSLNADQLAVVYAPLRSSLVVTSGPGSGKTRLLTHRLAHLIHSGDVRAYEVLAVTFTVKAAAEMRERLEQLLGEEDAAAVSVGTFHSLCARLLRKHGASRGISNSFTVLDTNGLQRFLKVVADQLGMTVGSGPGEINVRFATGLFQKFKSEPNWHERRLCDTAELEKWSALHVSQLSRLFDTYEELKSVSNVLDFADLLYHGSQLLSDANPELRDRIASRFKYVAVDEFQDANNVQFQLARGWASFHQSILVVGDPQQSIFTWRGAMPHSNFSAFFAAFPQAMHAANYSNYRSTQPICDLANLAMANDHIVSTRRHAGPAAPLPVLKGFDSGEQESRTAVKWIAELVARSGTRLHYGSCAVLLRTHSLTRSFEEALTAAGIPYVIVGATSFYEREEIQDLVAYLTLLANPHDSQAFLRVVNVPPRAIGPATIAKVQRRAEQERCSLYAAALGPDSPAKVRELMDLLQRLRSPPAQRLMDGGVGEGEEDGRSPSDVLLQVIKAVNYKEHLQRRHKEDWEARWENVGELVSVCAKPEFALDEVRRRHEAQGTFNFGESLDWALVALRDMVEEAALMQSASRSDTAGTENAVTLSTYHAAKGLEWDVVILPTLEQDCLPHYNALQQTDELQKETAMQEERRLFYVGLTRAKNFLFLSNAQRRTVFGKQRQCQPSEFLEDFESPLVTRHIDWEQAQAFVNSCLEPTGIEPQKSTGKRLVEAEREHKRSASSGKKLDKLLSTLE